MTIFFNYIFMKKRIHSLLWFIACIAQAVAQVQYVNPIIGTDGMGHTFPGACVPFGIVQLSPDTDTIPHNLDGVYQKKVYEYCAGYRYNDPTIVGFSHTHFNGTGHSDLGDILIMPTTGELKLNPGTADHPEDGYRSRFSHHTEKAVPGYYEVMLDDYQVKAQLTATTRVGIHRYIFPEGDQTGQGCDQRTHTANVDAQQQLSVIIRKLAQQNGRGHIADDLAGQYAEQQGAFFQKHGEEIAYRLDASHVSGEHEEEHKGQQQRIVHHFQRLPVQEEQHRRDEDQADPVRDSPEDDGHRQRKQ